MTDRTKEPLEAARQLVAALQGWLTKPAEGELGLHLSHRDQAAVDYLLSELGGLLAAPEVKPADREVKP